MVASTVAVDAAPSKTIAALTFEMSIGTARRPSTVLVGGARSKLVVIGGCRFRSAAAVVPHAELDDDLLHARRLHVLIVKAEAVEQALGRHLAVAGLLVTIGIVCPRDRRIEAVRHATHEVVVGEDRHGD